MYVIRTRPSHGTLSGSRAAKEIWEGPGRETRHVGQVIAKPQKVPPWVSSTGHLTPFSLNYLWMVYYCHSQSSTYNHHWAQESSELFAFLGLQHSGETDINLKHIQIYKYKRSFTDSQLNVEISIEEYVLDGIMAKIK